MPMFHSSIVTMKYVIERIIYFPTWLVYPVLQVDIFQIIMNV